MAKKYVCPVCKKEFEKVHSTNFAFNGSLLCSKKCFDTLISTVNEKPQTKTEEVQSTSSKVDVPQTNNGSPKPAVRKRKTTKASE